jgi:hypothetical protein
VGHGVCVAQASMDVDACPCAADRAYVYFRAGVSGNEGLDRCKDRVGRFGSAAGLLI